MKRIGLIALIISFVLGDYATAANDRRGGHRGREVAAAARANRPAPAPRALQRSASNAPHSAVNRARQFQNVTPRRFDADYARAPRGRQNDFTPRQRAIDVPTGTVDETATAPVSTTDRRNGAHRRRDWDRTRGARDGKLRDRDGDGDRDGRNHKWRHRDGDGHHHHHGGGWHRHRNRTHHHHHWWTSHYTRFALFGGGYYFWDSGFWYPAYGYDPYYSTYAYDAPIYGYNDQDPGEVMASVQSELARRGYYYGAIDSTYGPQTRAALVRFQQANGLAQTGMIDEPTLRALGLY